MKDFMTRLFVGSVLVSAAVGKGLPKLVETSRTPASQQDIYDLTIQSVSLDANSKLASLDNVYLRAIFGADRVVDLGRNSALKLSRGESKALNLHLEIERSWIRDDNLEFRIEVVQSGLFNSVLVRCSQVSREVSAYNRSYQCAIPGDQTPLLTYRLAKRGSPTLSVAQSQ